MALELILKIKKQEPKENSKPKPLFESIISEQIVRAKVEDTARMINALEFFWKYHISGAHLQAEIERMAGNTKKPEQLKALWNSLDNDAYLIAECLARPVLVFHFCKH